MDHFLLYSIYVIICTEHNKRKICVALAAITADSEQFCTKGTMSYSSPILFMDRGQNGCHQSSSNPHVELQNLVLDAFIIAADHFKHISHKSALVFQACRAGKLLPGPSRGYTTKRE